ncbi:unnamed protein product [marine sediment metagenome]|uniref:Uncharacterized protein n=1 Tax=marine sediment metagenome TaxID=412755 RepID=X1QK12_9ZZZZ
MKDPIDTVTHELPLKAKRGRPATGTAKSAAERKAEQRQRAFERFQNGDDLDTFTTAMLCEMLPGMVKEGFPVCVETIAEELTRRATENYRKIRDRERG